MNLSQGATAIKEEILRHMKGWNGNKSSFTVAVECYFSQAASELVKRIGVLTTTIQDMREDVQAVVCMPVVSFGSQDTEAVVRTLKRLDASASNCPKTEVLVLTNFPKEKPCDSTPERVEEVGAQLKNLRVQVVRAELAKHEQTAGYYRALMHGVTLLRSMRRGADVIQITLDADTVSLPNGYVRAYVNALKDPDVGAVVGQLDWGNETVDTRRLPELLVGNEAMRLLPKHGNWRILGQPSRYERGLVEECTFSPRSFGRGVQANLAWCGHTYARVGGYRPEEHDELDYILRKIQVLHRMHGLKFLWGEVGIVSDSRRALWALKRHGVPPMRQWSVPFVADDPVRAALPEMSEHLGEVPTDALQRQINLTLEAFNLPREELLASIMATLFEIGLRYDQYDIDLRPYEPDPRLSVAQVQIKDDRGLQAFVRRR